MSIIYKGYEYVKWEEIKQEWSNKSFLSLLLDDTILNEIETHCQTINNNLHLKFETYSIITQLLEQNNSQAIYENLDDIVNGYSLCVVCDTVIPAGEELNEIETEYTLCESCAVFDDELGGYVRNG